MIEQFKPLGTHDDQRRAALLAALAEAGIGRAYADRHLEEAGTLGGELKNWMIQNRDRIADGAGFDFRGNGSKAVDLTNLTARGLMLMGQHVLVIPLVRLPRMMNDEADALRIVQHLVVRDFETAHENPLRPYEIAQVEALIEDRLSDNRAVSVIRRVSNTAGWWGDTIEDLLAERCRRVDIA